MKNKQEQHNEALAETGKCFCKKCDFYGFRAKQESAEKNLIDQQIENGGFYE